MKEETGKTKRRDRGRCGQKLCTKRYRRVRGGEKIRVRGREGKDVNVIGDRKKDVLVARVRGGEKYRDRGTNR